MRVADVLRQATLRLRTAGIENPAREARLLLAHAAGLTQEALLGARTAEIVAPGFDALIDRRVAREPLALIQGHRGFWTLDLEVSPATLVPRPESETLIEAALAAFPDRRAVRRVLDLGTGTGCLLLAALSEFPAGFGIGVDRVPDALALARRNAVAAGLGQRTAFLCGDWAAALTGSFDLVLCNPPYIETGAIAGLMPEIAGYEPSTALDGGRDGMDAYRAILPCVAALVSADGAVVLELGASQADSVARLARNAGLADVATRPDLGGVERALIARKGAAGREPTGQPKKPFGSAQRGG